jgi:hypothetical protein
LLMRIGLLLLGVWERTTSGLVMFGYLNLRDELW